MCNANDTSCLLALTATAENTRRSAELVYAVPTAFDVPFAPKKPPQPRGTSPMLLLQAISRPGVQRSGMPLFKCCQRLPVFGIPHTRARGRRSPPRPGGLLPWQHSTPRPAVEKCSSYQLTAEKSANEIVSTWAFCPFRVTREHHTPRLAVALASFHPQLDDRAH